jgi:hypothetical protein
MAKRLYLPFDDIEASTTGFGIYPRNSWYAEIVGTDRSGRWMQVGRRVWVLGTRTDALNALLDSVEAEVRRKANGGKMR